MRSFTSIAACPDYPESNAGGDVQKFTGTPPRPDFLRRGSAGTLSAIALAAGRAKKSDSLRPGAGSTVKRRVSKLRPQFLALSLPKFAIDTTVQLKEDLMRAGMADAFTPGRAKFPLIGHDVFVSEALHDCPRRENSRPSK